MYRVLGIIIYLIWNILKGFLVEVVIELNIEGWVGGGYTKGGKGIVV